eukprot:NODE_459_length_7203_cov_0.898226.p7 type:complete len:130 gc:universal NODE_459_length_7203_cov_0.898226:6040-6429(+)
MKQKEVTEEIIGHKHSHMKQADSNPVTSTHQHLSHSKCKSKRLQFLLQKSPQSQHSQLLKKTKRRKMRLLLQKQPRPNKHQLKPNHKHHKHQKHPKHLKHHKHQKLSLNTNRISKFWTDSNKCKSLNCH